MTSIVIENIETRLIRFLRLELPEEADGQKKKLKFVQLGIHVNPTLTETSPLIKYRSVAKIDQKTNQSY